MAQGLSMAAGELYDQSGGLASDGLESAFFTGPHSEEERAKALAKLKTAKQKLKNYICSSYEYRFDEEKGYGQGN